MSGRLPYHVNEYNGNTCSHDFGIPLNMTTLSEKLVYEGGYEAHQIGKWHLGFASTAHTPFGRGFTSSLGYICARAEDHRTQEWSQPVNGTNCTGTDLWDTDKPAYGQNGAYGGYLYGKRALSIINTFGNNSITVIIITVLANHCLCILQHRIVIHLMKYQEVILINLIQVGINYNEMCQEWQILMMN